MQEVATPWEGRVLKAGAGGACAPAQDLPDAMDSSCLGEARIVARSCLVSKKWGSARASTLSKVTAITSVRSGSTASPGGDV